jgi:COP9 signalosome complex subunit 2
MHVREGEYEKAYTDFFEAFRNYDEAGSPRRIQCVKFLILLVMLRESKIDPFESPELKAYTENSQLMGFLKLFNCYQSENIREFEKVLQDYRTDIMDDPFIEEQIEDLVKGIRSTAVLNFIASGEIISLTEIAIKLSIPEEEIEQILVVLCKDQRINGKLALSSDEKSLIWKSQSIIEKERICHDERQTKRYDALVEWSTKLDKVILAVHNRIH